MRLGIGIASLSLFAGSATALSAQASGGAGDLEALIERDRARAVVIGRYTDGEMSIESLGRRSADDATVPGGETLFEIGSISKVFTALLTQVLVEAGKLDWDAAIASYLPDLEFASEAVAAITLRELASHTSGLPRLPANMEVSDPLDPYAGYGREHLLAFLGGYAPERLDKAYVYSNLGAGLLGQIAADAAGASYGEALRALVAAPLGMAQTAAGIGAGRQDRAATGFSDGADMPNWSGFDALAGAGVLVSSVNDLLRFVEANLGERALAVPLVAIRQPQAGGETGLGWHIRRLDDGAPVYWHNGGTGGYASFLALRPDTRSGVVVLTTSTAYEAVTEAGFRLIGAGAQPPAATDLQRYAGTYRLGEGFVLSVFLEDGRLFGQATGQGAFPLSLAGEHVFANEAAGLRIVFSLRESGPADSLTLHQAGTTTPAARVADDEGIARHVEIDIDPSRLPAYTGRYLLAPGIVIAVEARDGRLYAAVTGQPAYPVFPYAEDRFFYKVVDARLHFERDGSGVVVAVVLHQGGQQRAPRLE